MRSRLSISVLLVVITLFSVMPIHSVYADDLTLPNTTEELLTLNTSVMRKLCHTNNDVYSFGLGEYHCPQDIEPGSYIIYIFGSVDTIWKYTELRFTEPNGNTSTVPVDKNAMTTLKVFLNDGDSFSLLHGEMNYFGVQCFIAAWSKIGK